MAPTVMSNLSITVNSKLELTSTVESVLASGPITHRLDNSKLL